MSLLTTEKSITDTEKDTYALKLQLFVNSKEQPQFLLFLAHWKKSYIQDLLAEITDQLFWDIIPLNRKQNP